jgi:enoyl-CoA hydratase/carnithine racemase
VVEHIHDLMIPSLALVRGPALGGGCELALFCDLVLADETATFGVPEVKLGLFAPTGAILLPQLAGRNRALELMLTGDVISAPEAARMGLINRVLSAPEFDHAAEALIAKIASHSAVVLRFNHRAVDEARLLPFSRSIRHLEDMLLNQLMISEDAREGLAAYLQKRSPRWRNR